MSPIDFVLTFYEVNITKQLAHENGRRFMFFFKLLSPKTKRRLPIFEPKTLRLPALTVQSLVKRLYYPVVAASKPRL